MKILTILIASLLFIPRNLQAMSLGCDDFDTILCLQFNEGSGLSIRDSSKNQLNGQIEGGPVWLDSRAGFTNWSKRNFTTTLTSETHCPLNNGHYLYFTGTASEAVSVSTSSAFDWSTNKDYMIMFVAKFATLTPDNVSLMNWDQSLNLCGWSIEGEANGVSQNLLMQYSLVANYYWRDAAGNKFTFTDTRPHSFGIWHENASATMDMYVDGKLLNTITSVGDSITCPGGSALKFSQNHVVGNNANYSIGPVQMWKRAIPRGMAPSFFKAWHDKHFYGNQSY